MGTHRLLSLSPIGYGAWITGADPARQKLDVANLARAIDTAVNCGMTWIDTAELYGLGLSEETVGRALRDHGDLFVATKVAPEGAGSGLRPEQIRDAVERSLRRLGVDRIELYQVHWHDPAVPVEETWGEIRDLVDRGLVRMAGVSNFTRELIERCLSVGPVDAVQNQFSLLHSGDRGELLPWLDEKGIAYFGYGSLAFGLLSARFTADTRFEQWDWRSGREMIFERNYFDELFAPGRIEGSLAFAEQLGALAGELGIPTGVLALRWALAQTGVTGLVVGSTNPDHIRTNSTAGDEPLDHETLKRIDEMLKARAAGEVSAR